MFKIVKRSEYNLMRKMVERQDNYIDQIKIQNEEINDLKYDNQMLRDAISDNNAKIKSLIGKIGGLKASNNCKVKDNKFLKEQIDKLNSELFEIKNQLIFYKKYGKSNEKLEKIKNYKEIRKEFERRARVL